jgi:hypothetical protein
MVPQEKVAGIAFFLALILLVSGFFGCASTGVTGGPPPGQREFYVPAVDEGLFGTWVNAEYGSPSPAPKLVIYAWGLVEWFAGASDKTSSWVGTSIVVEKWMDEQGDTWYKEFRRDSGGSLSGGQAFVLDRVGSNGMVLESIYGTSGWPSPSEMAPGRNPTYVTYRRQE